ncbi:gliding motility protein [Streptomyces sp. CS62]
MTAESEAAAAAAGSGGEAEQAEPPAAEAADIPKQQSVREAADSGAGEGALK